LCEIQNLTAAVLLFLKLQNPEMRALLTNTEALQSIMQIQQQMQRLQQIASPNLLAGFVFRPLANYLLSIYLPLKLTVFSL
jgi:hypothetical protein